MRAILDEKAIRVAHAAALASDERTMPILECVVIGNGAIIAADGFLMIKRSITTEPPTGSTMLIKAKVILDCHRQWKSKLMTIESDKDNSSALIRDENENTFKAEILDKVYPNYTILFPKTKREAYVALDIRLLKKALKTFDNKGFIRVKIWKPDMPVELSAEGTKGMIMPTYVEE